MRLTLFTDTLGDVNGVSRFIQNVAAQSLASGRELDVITSTSFPAPDAPNIHNFKPVLTARMPGYEQLEIVLPPLVRMFRHVSEHRPDVIHISTPGPVGLVGFMASRTLRVPVLGVYHTDFPAYIDRLFEDHTFTSMCSTYMKWFYKPFRRVFTRSADYSASLERLGIPGERLTRLKPGIETRRFNTSFRDDALWSRLARESASLRGIERPGVRAVYVGRVSVEKNLPMLAAVWKRVRQACQRDGLDARLVIVGDGPYCGRMRDELGGDDAHFLGFRHGDELSSIYATSDLFLFPSVTDTLGQVVMESQCSGVPVIVTDRGGPKEVVRHGETGFVLPAKDEDLWARTIVGLIRDEPARRRMSRAAAESMREFDISASFEHFWRVHVDAWHEHLASAGVNRGDGRRRSVVDPVHEPAAAVSSM